MVSCQHWHKSMLAQIWQPLLFRLSFYDWNNKLVVVAWSSPCVNPVLKCSIESEIFEAEQLYCVKNVSLSVESGEGRLRGENRPFASHYRSKHTTRDMTARIATDEAYGWSMNKSICSSIQNQYNWNGLCILVESCVLVNMINASSILVYDPACKAFYLHLLI